MSLEVPGADVFTKEWNPELDINLSSNAEVRIDDHYRVTLTVSVNAKNAEAPAFIAEVHQAGIFLLKDIPEDWKVWTNQAAFASTVCSLMRVK